MDANEMRNELLSIAGTLGQPAGVGFSSTDNAIAQLRRLADSLLTDRDRFEAEVKRNGWTITANSSPSFLRFERGDVVRAISGEAEFNGTQFAELAIFYRQAGIDCEVRIQGDQGRAIREIESWEL